jgi:hypothetical protein
LEVSEEVFHQTVENALDASIIQLGVGEEIEMPDHSTGNDGLSSSGGSHGTEHHHVLEVSQSQLFPVVPSFVVQELTQDFNRRLSTVLFFFRHVQIIYEYYHLLLKRRPVNSSSTFVSFRVNCVLGLVGRGLGREGNGDILISFSHLSLIRKSK